MSRTDALLPEWLAIVWTMAYLAIGVSHLVNLRTTTGQRRPWHACHVLMAVGMAFMYAPADLDPLSLPAGFWQAVFAVGGLVAAGWAITGVGRVSTLIWLLTAFDLGAMLFMWSRQQHPSADPAGWLIVAYLTGAALMWALDLYRRFDHRTPIVRWQLLAVESTGDRGTAAPAGAGGATLLDDRDISASMVLMTLGMAYMLLAMQLMSSGTFR